jgi:hypothetical protein
VATLTEILQDRGEVYGSYADKTAFVQNLKDMLRAAPSWQQMNSGQREAMDMIATKLGRLSFGDPNHEDSWVDIGGYADLAAHGDIQKRGTMTLAVPATVTQPSQPAHTLGDARAMQQAPQ